MARGNTQTYYKRFYATIKAKKGTEPYFDMQRNEPGDYILQPGETRSKTNAKIVRYEEKQLGGQIAKIEITQNEFEGHIIESLELTLRDHAVRENYIVKAGMESNMGRNLMNALLNIKDLSLKLDVSLYVNKDGYNTLSVQSGGEWAGFKLKYEEYKPLIRTYIGKHEKQEYDWSKVTEFFKKQFTVDLLPRLNEYLQFADIAPKEEVKSNAAPSSVKRNPVAEQIQQAQEEEAVPDLLSQVREERANNPKGKGSESQMLEATNDLPF